MIRSVASESSRRPAKIGREVAGETADRPAYERRLERALGQREVAGELFLPAEAIRWRRGTTFVPRRATALARSSISGVRFQGRDRKGGDPAPVRQCQSDLVRLVRSLRLIRTDPLLGRVLLARRPLSCRAGPRGSVTRAKFGLSVPAESGDDARGGDPAADERRAATTCHRRIVRAARRAGFVVESPAQFDPAGGLPALEAWAGEVVLRRRARPSPWWLLLLALLVLPFLPWGCDERPTFFGVPIATSSFVLLVDKSSSMEPHFESVRAEVARLLADLERGSATSYVDLVCYDSQARSALGGLQALDDRIAAKLRQETAALAAGGGTNLRSGLELAAREVAAHGRETTLVVLTDGEDGSLAQMLNSMPEVAAQFGGVDVVVHTLTPRLFGGQGDPQPQSQPEQRLSRLAEELHGHFGPVRNDE